MCYRDKNDNIITEQEAVKSGLHHRNYQDNKFAGALFFATVHGLEISRMATVDVIKRNVSRIRH